LAATVALVWAEHKAVFRSAGRTFGQFWGETWREFDSLYHTSATQIPTTNAGRQVTF
jgi:hypothetical protein